MRIHLLGTTVSLINGCEYCAFGHAYALDLIYLRDHGRLFPLTTDCAHRPAERDQDLAARAVRTPVGTES